jgi:hypothetical protein
MIFGGFWPDPILKHAGDERAAQPGPRGRIRHERPSRPQTRLREFAVEEGEIASALCAIDPGCRIVLGHGGGTPPGALIELRPEGLGARPIRKTLRRSRACCY